MQNDIFSFIKKNEKGNKGFQGIRISVEVYENNKIFGTIRMRNAD